MKVFWLTLFWFVWRDRDWFLPPFAGTWVPGKQIGGRRTQALTRFSISRKSRKEMVHFFLSRAGELNFHFLKCSRMSRFWRKNSRSPLEIRDLEKNSLSLLEGMRFCKHILFLFSRFKILREKVHFLLSIFPLNFSSNSREKSKFAILVDFDQQCFAERESISKRQFCVVEQYSFFSQQKHFMETSNKSLLWEYFERLHNGKTI